MNRIVVILMLFLASPSLAETGTVQAKVSTAERPTIGIALGGGGARGVSHVGVLERLDELCIPVDKVAGTSMGSVIGVLFALGYTPQEIKYHALKADWGKLMNDRPERGEFSFRRKADDRDNLWPFEFGFTSKGLALQRSLLVGQKLNYLFREPGHYLAGQDSFENLPIPFFPVATDLMTGQQVVLKKGNLLKSVRASMAAPGAFPPVEIDGRTLSDGYLRNNVPVDVVRDMGVDKVIAVHTGWSPGEDPANKYWDLPSLVVQGSYILTYGNVEPQLEAADVALSVWQPGVALHDFSDVEKSIAAGRAAVDAHLQELLPLALPEAEYRQWREGIRLFDRAPAVINQIRIDNQTLVNDQAISHRISQSCGDTLNFHRLVSDLERVYELGVFESVEFSLREAAGTTDLVVHPIAKPYLPWVLRLGGSYQMSYQNRGQIQLLARLTRLEINRFGAELRSDLAIGGVHGITAEFYQPLGYSRTIFVAPILAFNSRNETVFNETYPLGEYEANFWTGQMDVGVNLSRSTQLRMGIQQGKAAADAKSGALDYGKLEDQVGALIFEMEVDRLDHFAVPRRGLFLNARAYLARQNLGDDYDFSRYWGNLSAATSAGDWVFQFRFGAGSSEGQMPYYRQFLMGGLRNLTGIADGSLRGEAYGMAGLGVLKHFSGLSLPLANQWYLGLWGDVGNTWHNPQAARFDDTLYGGALTLLLDTAMGPIEAGYGRSSTGRGTIYLQAGIPFSHTYNP